MLLLETYAYGISGYATNEVSCISLSSQVLINGQRVLDGLTLKTQDTVILKQPRLFLFSSRRMRK
jgi:hypothetical protein